VWHAYAILNFLHDELDFIGKLAMAKRLGFAPLKQALNLNDLRTLVVHRHRNSAQATVENLFSEQWQPRGSCVREATGFFLQRHALIPNKNWAHILMTSPELSDASLSDEFACEKLSGNVPRAIRALLLLAMKTRCRELWLITTVLC